MKKPRVMYVGECSSGHKLRDFLAPGDIAAVYCDWLIRDERGAWEESYGRCGQPIHWTHIGAA